MHHVTDERDALWIDEEFACDCGAEPEPWRWLFYEDRDDAFEAVDAADILGLAWRLTPRWCAAGDLDVGPQWVLQFGLETTLPEAASGEITRDVE